MKKIYFLFFALIGFISNTFSQDYYWTKHSGEPSGIYSKSIEASDMAVSNSGNIHLTGNFRNTGDFDFGVDKYILSAEGNYYDVYVSKYDSEGHFIWAKSFGNSGYESSTSLVVDQDENIYISGSFEGSVDFDPDPSSEFILTSPEGKSRNYILKLNMNGNFVWAKSFGNQTNSALKASIAIDSNSNIICVGGFRELADFDPADTNIYNLSSNGNEDIYILKLNSDGEFIWAKSLTGSPGNDYATAVAVDNTDNIIVGGEFYGTVDFNPDKTTFNIHTSLGLRDYFLLKLDSVGNYIWSKTAGGVKSEQITDIAIDKKNEIYISGYLEDHADVDPSDNVFELRVKGFFNAFMAKFQSNGDFISAFNLDGENSLSQSTSISVDQDNNVYFSGHFVGTVDVDLTEGIENRTAIGHEDYFVIKLNGHLDYQWAQTYGFTEGYAYVMDLELNSFGELITFQKIDVYRTNMPDFDFTADSDIQPIDSYSNIAISKWAAETCTLRPIATLNNPVVSQGTTFSDLVLTPTFRNPISYTIDYDLMAETEGFLDITTTTGLKDATFAIPPTANFGVYNGTITYIDINGCSGTDDFTISVVEPLSEEDISISILTGISCSGNSDASIKVNMSGSSRSYLYELLDLNDIVIKPKQASDVFLGLSAGDYMVKVLDNKGLVVSRDSIGIIEPMKLAVQVTITAATCKEADNGAIEIEVQGGTSPYEYYINGEKAITSNIFGELFSGHYEIDIIDAKGCKLVKQINVGVKSGPDFDNDGASDICDDDIDGDGILNEDDECPRTIIGNSVNLVGCANFTLPSTNFTIQITGESCSNSNNGSIIMIATENFDYKATLSGGGRKMDMEFNSFTNFEGLASDQYEVCITVVGHPEYEKCFTIQIPESEPFSVDSKIDVLGKSVSLKLKGGTKYDINLNGVTYTTSESEITLPLTRTENSISVMTDKNCQGVYKDTFLINYGVSVYPNPVGQGDVRVLVFDDIKGIVQLSLFDSAMKLVREKNQKLVNGSLNFNMDDLAAGLYSLRIVTDRDTYVRKILKE